MNFWSAILFAFVIGLVNKSAGLMIENPLQKTVQEQFGTIPNCRGEKEHALDEITKEIFSIRHSVSNTIKQLATERVTKEELSALVTNYCHRNKDMEFESKLLVESVQNCFGNRYRLSKEKKLEAEKAFVDSVCGAEYASLHWNYFNARYPKRIA
ncbi:uncharacterized protein LOC117172383 [Belonocnema kinseyi]|uniref:uncharacterized protein LOC117172383 n=1 Tax=Belonocnema kinseyi TaxID=2817044 RepID=UPI00143DCAD0|nr:uncharacterized protein LOC117172383 [Belonocnema kinseyi]